MKYKKCHGRCATCKHYKRGGFLFWKNNYCEYGMPWVDTMRMYICPIYESKEEAK